MNKDFYVTLLGGWFGLHKYMKKQIGMGLLYTFTFGLFGIGWIIDIITTAMQKSARQTSNITKIDVVGEYYRKDDICAVLSGNRMYNLPDDAFIEKVEARRNIYRYKYRETDVVLVPEPTNQHDPNAIKVMVDNFHVGYIPAGQCAELKKKLNKIKSVRAKIHNGDYKYHTRHEVFKVENDFSIEINITI